MLTLKEKLYELLAPIITTMGYELWGLEVPEQTSGTLRIYIDSDQGITLDDLTKVNEQVGAILDVEDIIKHKYALEVSSPGLNRPLFTEKQYKKFIGNNVKVHLLKALDERKNYQGTIKEVTKKTLTLFNSEENKQFALPIELIAKANLQSAN